jgi:hypothetical protein
MHMIVRTFAILVLSTLMTTLAAQQPQSGSDKVISHADLSVYTSDDGTTSPIRTPDDWQIRRKQILQGMQLAMGPLPTRNTALPFDIHIADDIRLGNVRRLTLSIVVENTDRLPLRTL